MQISSRTKESSQRALNLAVSELRSPRESASQYAASPGCWDELPANARRNCQAPKSLDVKGLFATTNKSRIRLGVG
jgi:hypothetical protein